MPFTVSSYCIELFERQVFILLNPIYISEAKQNERNLSV